MVNGNGTKQSNTSSTAEPIYLSYKYDVPATAEENDQESLSIVKVLRRFEIESDNDLSTTETNQTICTTWALILYEYNVSESVDPGMVAPRRFIRWRRFKDGNQLMDHMISYTSEPVTLPPLSLSPQQSQRIEEQSRQAVARVKEEFRRFRVKAEVGRKQSDATVRSLQCNNALTAKKQIEGHDISSELAQARSDHEELANLRKQMVEQEAYWREAYDTILIENASLRSSGSEALLAAQWRQRFETCMSEKEKLETAFAMERLKSGKISVHHELLDSNNYESKYKDLKESFRLYRKKAKEIFEAQQKGDTVIPNFQESIEESKISYLRNLMANYLSCDPSVRDHMENAIMTVLKFSQEDRDKVSKQKAVHQTKSSWF